MMLHMLLDALANQILFFALHLSNTGSFPPPLSAEEEHKCLVAYANGDNAARDKLIEHNLRLAIFIKSPMSESPHKIKGSGVVIFVLGIGTAPIFIWFNKTIYGS